MDEQLREPLRGVLRRLIDAERSHALDRAQAQLEDELRALSSEGAITVIRALTILFDLENIAEDRQRIRTLRRREEAAYPAPRSESVAEAVQDLADTGLMPEHLQQLFGALLIKPVLTAHPTEAKRYEIIRMLRNIKSELAELERTPQESPSHNRIRARIKAHLTTMWQTERIRPSRPTVLDEAEHALSFLQPLWNVVPELYQDLRAAVLSRYPGSSFEPPAFFRFGSWIGGDRDGNPNVTADVTRQVVLRQRRRVLELHIDECERVVQLLTTSDRLAGVSQALRERLSELEARHPEVRAAARPFSTHEPYRRFFAAVGWRLRRARASVFREDGLSFLPGAYTHSDELIGDIELAMDSLRAHNGERSLENLRAIPWVFSWSQSRFLLPAWFGLGAAVKRYAGKHGWDPLREMYAGWRFFRTVIDNAALALAKTDMAIAERYAELVEDAELGRRLYRWIAEEHRRTAEAIVRVTGSAALLDTTPWLRDVLRKRNPFTLPLNLSQVIWLERARTGEPDAQAEAHEVVRLTIQGVASALRNTG